MKVNLSMWVEIIIMENMHKLCHFFVNFHGNVKSNWVVKKSQKIQVDKFTVESHLLAFIIAT